MILMFTVELLTLTSFDIDPKIDTIGSLCNTDKGYLSRPWIFEFSISDAMRQANPEEMDRRARS